MCGAACCKMVGYGRDCGRLGHALPSQVQIRIFKTPALLFKWNIYVGCIYPVDPFSDTHSLPWASSNYLTVWSWLYWHHVENEETEAVWGRGFRQGSLAGNWEDMDKKLKFYGPRPSYFSEKTSEIRRHRILFIYFGIYSLFSYLIVWELLLWFRLPFPPYFHATLKNTVCVCHTQYSKCFWYVRGLWVAISALICSPKQRRCWGN